MTVNSALPNAYIDQAITWIARLRAHDVSAEERSRFAEWIASDARHSAAFDEIFALWQRLGVVAYLSGDHARTTHMLRNGKTGAAIASLTLAGLLAFTELRDGREYETVDGAQRTVVLDDGSKVLLNSNTSIDVDMAANERRITLRHGEAYFEVAMDRHRPFVVASARCTATAVGTAFAFEVRAQPHHDAVIVTQGAVRVVVGEQSIDVGENEEAIITDDVAKAPVDAAAQSSWRNAP
jgi:transmembrane sensor